MKRLIILMRHGIAEDPSAGQPDAERELTPLGLRRTRAAALGLRKLVGRTDAIWSSPLVRSMQTADEVARAWRDRHTVRLVDELQPDRSPEELTSLLLSTPEARIVAVGHEPLLSRVAAALISSTADLPPLRKAGCYGVRLRDGGRAELRFLLPPRILRRAAR